jgi:hypothetical protein
MGADVAIEMVYETRDYTGTRNVCYTQSRILSRVLPLTKGAIKQTGGQGSAFGPKEDELALDEEHGPIKSFTIFSIHLISLISSDQ